MNQFRLHFQKASIRSFFGCLREGLTSGDSLWLLAFVAFYGVNSAGAEEAKSPAWNEVRPVLDKYCFQCHGGEKTKGAVDLKALAEDPKVADHFAFWEDVSFVIEDEEMPPVDDPQPSEAEKQLLTRWLDASLDAVAQANAGDPGEVTVRRLTNVEYDNTIRDITGIDFGLSDKFQPDGGGGEGFSNVGDVLFVNPQQLDSYLSAARYLTDRASILPGRGVNFRKERVGLRSPMQFKAEAEQSLYIWYQKMAAPHLPKDDEDRRGDEYMLAAWKYKHREKTGAGSLDQLAKEAGLSAAFLNNWWELLNIKTTKSRFLDMIVGPWNQLPGPAADKPKEVPEAVKKAIAGIEARHLSWNKREGEGWVRTQRRQQDSDGLRSRAIKVTIQEGQPIHVVAGDFGDGGKGDLIVFDSFTIEEPKQKSIQYLDWLKKRLGASREQLKKLKADPKADPKVKATQIAGLEKFIREGEKVMGHFGKHPLGREVKPHMLVVQAPATITLPAGMKCVVRASAKMEMNQPDGGADLASHQWTVTGSSPPNPKAIIPGALVIYKRSTPIARTIMGEFSRMKAAFPDEYNRLLEEVSRNYQRGGKGMGVYYLNDEQLRATLTDWGRTEHERMLRDWALLKNPKPDEKTSREIDQGIMAHVHWWAHRAWRRDLTSDDRKALSAIYDAARARGMDSETAAREVLTQVFVSPEFLFKLEGGQEPGIHPVSPWELASRLSYLLWASTPDTALLDAARDGSLMTPEGRAAQVKRMLKSHKAEALAAEFAGQWLEFHGFTEHNSVDEKTFPEFTPELRADMLKESEAFFAHLIREDLPVREVLMADYTFLNERLAKHYGVPGVSGGEFRKVSVAKYQRGGLLGMGSILTKTSFPQRTSPVLRGNWLLNAVLGQPTPPPPPDVPELEAIVGAKTLREKLELHREDKACASCHEKLDPLGFALESFDAIGRFRSKDESGLSIDDLGTLKDGTELKGIAGLRDYLAENDADFYELFAKKLIGYSTGRSLIATDRELVENIRKRLQAGEGRFSDGILTMVESRQFLSRRNELTLSD
ncbi:DUF1592 domain-containing protein [Verrucomicrobiales bacterium BCK34]|nr:DUF1592 domain-containing protein [Verrucomicrobiales bacterium BCK34]